MASSRESDLQVHCFSIFLLGKNGVGKSACGNTLLGEQVFYSKKSVKSVTVKVQKQTVTFNGVNLEVIDTPGLLGPEANNDINEWKNLLSQTSCPVILLVLKADSLSSEDKQVVELIEDEIPKRFMQNVWILFTRGDELERENVSIENFIEETDELKEILKRFKNRYHVFNNLSRDSEQVKKLILKICTKATVQNILPLTPPPPHHHRMIILVGKTGVGKSATGNTILGKSVFRSESSSSSVTFEAKKQQAVVSGWNISVIDTPGLFDTNLTCNELNISIGKSIYEASPGPHAFLYVQSVNERFTTQEKCVLPKLELIFGKDMLKYTIIVFTFGDMLEGKSVDTFVNENSSLRQLTEQCGGRYHILNNKQRNKKQVTDLLEKINRMVQQNEKEHYTNEMFQKAQKFKNFNEFYHECKTSLYVAASVGCGGGAVGGVVTGVIIGASVGGPVGAGIGAAVGSVLGIATGGGIGIGIYKLKNKQNRQNKAHIEHEEDSDTDRDTVTGTEGENVPLYGSSKKYS